MRRNIDIVVTDRSTLELFPLRVVQEAEEFIAGRPTTGSYVVLSRGGLEAAELLARGRSIAQTKAALAAMRLRSLLETLLAAGMVKSVDGVPLIEPLAPRRYHLTFLRRRHVAWLFSRPAIVAYALLVTGALGIMLGEPRYLPRASDALVVSNPVQNLVLLWSVSLLAMAAHEMSHLLAATFLGVGASFAISYRLFFAVAQTDLTDLWLVSRNKRYLAYVAGMANDLLVASAAVVALWLHDQGFLPPAAHLYGTLRLVVLVQIFGVLWQFNFYLRTDVYYVIANAVGCRNLSQDARTYLKGKVARLCGHAAPAMGLRTKEMRVVRGYAWLMVIGTVAVVATGAAYAAALVLVLLGHHPIPAPHVSGPVARGGLSPALVSLAVTCAWLGYAVIERRRRRPRVCYRLRAPEGL